MAVVAVMRAAAESSEAIVPNLAAVVLLGGSVRPRKLSEVIGRPMFELPLRPGFTILDHWCREVASLGDGAHCMKLRVMMERAAAEPLVPATQADGVDLSIERDPFEYRGTGGVLRDLAVAYENDELLLVANAAQILIQPLKDLVAHLAGMRADVAVLSHLDGTVGGTYLIRCGVLRELPASGFLDLKEQALPAIAAQHIVRVYESRQTATLPVRTLSDYTTALRWHHRLLSGRSAQPDPLEEDLEPAFALVEPGAEVHPAARLHDSVVLRGGRVEADATLVHCIVCPGGVVRRGRMIVDEIVAPGHRAD